MPLQSKLSNLPNELLCEIFLSLHRVDLVKICSVSHHLRLVAEALLYREVHLASRTIQMFLRTILNRPDLAKHVQLFQSKWIAVQTTVNSDWKSLENSELILAIAAARKVGLQQPKTRRWHISTASQHVKAMDFYVNNFRLLEAHYDSICPHVELLKLASTANDLQWDRRTSLLQIPPNLLGLNRESLQWHATQVVLLLHLLPNIKILDLTPPHVTSYYDSEFLHIFLAELVHPSLPVRTLPIGLMCVREIYVNGTGGVTVMMLLALFKLPSLRKLVAFMVVGDPEQPSEDDLDIILTSYAQTSSVTELSLNDSPTATSKLDKILQIPKALTHFSYGEIRSCLASAQRESLNKAIACHRQTLQYLSLGIFKGFLPDAVAVQTIPSWRDWPVLRSIRSPLLTLLGRKTRGFAELSLARVLPVAIEELIIDYGTGWTSLDTANEMAEFIELKGFSGHNDLTMVGVGEGRALRGIILRRLVKACRAGGVELRLDQ